MADNQNTKNTDSPLFKRLTRLFSGPIINYRTQNTRQLQKDDWINMLKLLKMLPVKNLSELDIIL